MFILEKILGQFKYLKKNRPHKQIKHNFMFKYKNQRCDETTDSKLKSDFNL